MADKMPETEVAQVFQLWMEHIGWKLYPEVVLKGFGGRPDFIGTRGSICSVFECKQTLTWGVVEQLHRWKNEWLAYRPHLASAVVGSSSYSDLRMDVLKQGRFGLFVVSRHYSGISHNEPVIKGHYLCMGEYRYVIEEVVAPRILEGSRKTAIKIVEQLNDDMLIAEAGARGGATEYMTPFKRTMNRVKQALSCGEPMHIDSILRKVDELGGHHYSNDSSFKQCVPKYIIDFGVAKKAREYGPWFQRTKPRKRPK